MKIQLISNHNLKIRQFVEDELRDNSRGVRQNIRRHVPKLDSTAWVKKLIPQEFIHPI